MFQTTFKFNTNNLLPILIAGLAVAIGAGIAANSAVTSNAFGSTIAYHSEVCIGATLDGTYQTIQCKANTFTQRGQNMTRDVLGTPFTAATNDVNVIALGNRTDILNVSIVEPDNYNEYVSCGLERGVGTYATDPAYNGNWSIQRTFTSTCSSSQTINVTALLNSTSKVATDFIFAYNTFTSVTLQQNDQINVTWKIWVS